MHADLTPSKGGSNRITALPSHLVPLIYKKFCAASQVAYLLVYGELPDARELARWDEALMRHSAVPDAVERAVAALPHDAHFMGIVLTALNALSTVHPEQNPALAGQNIYLSKEIQDKQIVRLIGAC